MRSQAEDLYRHWKRVLRPTPGESAVESSCKKRLPGSRRLHGHSTVVFLFAFSVFTAPSAPAVPSVPTAPAAATASTAPTAQKRPRETPKRDSTKKSVDHPHTEPPSVPESRVPKQPRLEGEAGGLHHADDKSVDPLGVQNGAPSNGTM